MLIEETLEKFLDEDIGHGDITTDALVDSRTKATGQVVCKERAVIAGLSESIILLKLLGCEGKSKVRDGQEVPAGTIILEVDGSGSSLLKVERVLLNLLSHMSGVATATAELVSIAKKNGSSARIACTRKTLPGLRYFEKRAVELGGGDTHRLRLDDAVLIKDNHLELAGSITESVRKAKARVSFIKKIEVEATSPGQAVEAGLAGADIVLLDNMTPQEVKRSLTLLETKKLRDRLLIEVSGGITRENLSNYVKTGADVISIGSITHSAKAIDMSLEVHSHKK
ncbi:carboxylating nicotinate-nucleotide diphosphorylase [Candidatus Bathyarchaeota archaeon]|nr:MAG: carboxylating nicotinate-nucleotide diphosphorylase [Candidatus Bathyarchaeota archaeon]TMI52954.1 MAG: carboxylating nicotinate-nucleotide diphosphorylase [Candidatus Bathyarchaeota archaeon]